MFKRFLSGLASAKAASPSASALPMRTHLIGNLNDALLKQQVSLAGWVAAIRRVSRNLIFLLVRDHSGSVQVTLTKTHVAEHIFQQVQQAIESGELTNEAVIRVNGILHPRPIGQANSEMQQTGALELFPEGFQILNRIHEKLPFTLKESPAEDVRLQFRFLDLRREEMQRVLRLRSQMSHLLRSYFIENGN